MGSLNKITCHWTGGAYKPNATDLEHYHFLVDGDGNIINGKHKPQDNENCTDGNYAAHCGGGNTGNIGIALCGMYSVNYPIRRVQLEAMCKKIAELSKAYSIPIRSDRIFTHSEFGERNKNSTSYGKVDIDKLPCIAVYGRQACGNWIRSKVNFYRSKM